MQGLWLGIPAFLLALTCHEVAHGYVAKRLGDPTAEELGRLTLNPIKHISLFGTIMFPLMLYLAHSPVIFGWAKPVPVDPRYFRHPLRGMMWVGMAGPVANFILATMAAVMFRLLAPLTSGQSILLEFVFFFMLVNTVLGFFNLIPIPPLDGSRIVTGLLPRNLAIEYMKLERFGFLILIGLLYLGVFGRFVFPFAIRCCVFLGGDNLLKYLVEGRL